jgi:predicted nucleic acid-binding Zn ribbon protein
MNTIHALQEEKTNTSICLASHGFNRLQMMEKDYTDINDMGQSRRCPFCEKPIIGRSDKRFCSTPCRNAWHNEERKQREKIVIETNKRLKRNWNILRKLNKSGKTKVTLLQLVAAEFDFSLSTSVLTNKDGRTYWFCYDQGWLKLENDQFLLVKKN